MAVAERRDEPPPNPPHTQAEQRATNRGPAAPHRASARVIARSLLVHAAADAVGVVTRRPQRAPVRGSGCSPAAGAVGVARQCECSADNTDSWLYQDIAVLGGPMHGSISTRTQKPDLSPTVSSPAKGPDRVTSRAAHRLTPGRPDRVASNDASMHVLAARDDQPPPHRIGRETGNTA